MKKIDWTNHFIELIVVFIGITAAFLLNGWRENRAQENLALKYYNSLLKDLSADADALDGILSFAANQDSTINNFISLFKANESYADQIPSVMTTLVSFNQFAPELATFETIRYSGNLDVFSDYELREEINSYYSLFAQVSLTQDLQVNYVSTYCFPYIFENFDLMNGKLISGAIIDQQFLNLVLGFQVLLRQNLSMYQTVMEKNMELKLKIAQKLSD